MGFRDVKYREILEQAYCSGRLTEIIKRQWKLNSVPVVSDIDFEIESSNHVKKHTVNIAMKSNTMNTLSTPQSSRQSSRPSVSTSSPNRSTNDLSVMMPKCEEMILPEAPSNPYEGYTINIMETFTPEAESNDPT